MSRPRSPNTHLFEHLIYENDEKQSSRPGFKLQTPSNREVTSHKPQARPFEPWSLEFPWCLEFGAWSFIFPPASDLRPPTSARSPSRRRPFLSMNLPAVS